MGTQTKYAVSGLLIGIVVVGLMIKFVDFGTSMGAPILLFVILICITVVFNGMGRRIENRKK